MLAAVPRRPRKYRAPHGKPGDSNTGQHQTPPRKPLTPQQRRQRANDANPLYNPLQTLTGNALIRGARQLADLQVAPAISAQKRANAEAATQGTALVGRAGDYYGELDKRDQDNGLRQRAISEWLDARLKDVGSDTQQTMAQQKAAEDATQADAAATQGRTVSPEVDKELGILAASAAAATGRARQAGGAQSANYEQLTNALDKARQLRGGEVQGELLNRLANVQNEGRGKLADLRTQRGGLVNKNVLDLRNTGFENILAGKSLDIKQQDILTGLQIAKGAQATSRRNASLSAAQSDINNRRTTETSMSNAQLAAQVSRGNTAARIRAQKEIARRSGPASVNDRQFLSSARVGVQKANTHKSAGRSRAEAARRMLRGSPNIDPLLVSVSLDLAYDGHVSRANRVKLRQAGYPIPQG